MAKKFFEDDPAPKAPPAPSGDTLAEKQEAYRLAAEGGKASRKELEAMRLELRTLRELVAKR